MEINDYSKINIIHNSLIVLDIDETIIKYDEINNDWWMGHRTIIKSGAADSVAVVVCNSELVDMFEDVTKSTLLFDVKAFDIFLWMEV